MFIELELLATVGQSSKSKILIPFNHSTVYLLCIIKNWDELCLRRIDDDLNVKVTDCALSRDLFPQDYCCLGDNENRPVKWMAVESLEHGRYSLASDGVRDIVEG